MLANKIKEKRREIGLTLEEVATALGTSKQTIHRYENGVISNIPHDKIRRLAEVLRVSPSELMGWDETFSPYDNVFQISENRLPIIGTIACGEPIYADQEYGSYVSASGNIDASFCLRAKGDSMVGARINDGDLVFIRAQDSVDNGDIAAVIINDEATLKRVYYYPDEGKLVLLPENPRYAPLVYINEELNSIKIMGKAVAFQSKII
ncbi:MAG: helix-turn-helix domain-containing protein [Clostridia bacterium]|nr:helix-turn-helix domain-containing protein [Clostridia bacterium]